MTRAAARIPFVLDRLRVLWEANPDQRLTQLIFNISSDIGSDMSPSIYNMEEDELLRRIEKMINERVDE